MSRRISMGYNLARPQYSLKYIIMMFILFDIVLWFAGVGMLVMNIIFGFEISNIIGLLMGLRGQAKYREFIFGLRIVADDHKYDNKEELRGHLLKQQIRYACIEHDIWMLKSTKNNSIKKKTIKIKRGDKRKMNDKTIIEIMRTVASIWLTLGLGLWDFLFLLGLRFLWIIVIVGIFWILDLFFWLIMENEFGILKEETKPLPVPHTEEIARLKAEIATLST